MTMNLKNLLIIPIIVSLLFIMTTINVHAEGTSLTVNTSSVSPITQENTIVNGVYNPAGEFPTVKIDTASDFIEGKGYEIVGFLQRVIQPFAIIIFIIGAIIAMLGFVNKNALRVGFIVIIVSVVMYTAVLFAPELLTYFSGWMSSK